jgi:hypothetical protein
MCWSSARKFVIYCLFVLCWSVQLCVASPYGNDIAARSKPKGKKRRKITGRLSVDCGIGIKRTAVVKS